MYHVSIYLFIVLFKIHDISTVVGFVAFFEKSPMFGQIASIMACSGIGSKTVLYLMAHPTARKWDITPVIYMG